MDKIIKYIFFILIFTINFNNNLYAIIFKFNDLEKARKLYSTNPIKAHELIDSTINHYIKKPNKKWPWLGYAYQQKADFLKQERDIKLALEYQTKSCEEQKKDFKKIKKNHKTQNILQCYYFLSTLLRDNNFFEESINISTLAINIAKEFEGKNYEVYDFYGPEEFSYIVVARARTYLDLFMYDEAIKDFKKYLDIVSKNINELSSDNYVDALSEIEFAYSRLGDSKNEYKYLKLRYDIIQQYNKDNFKLQAKINRQLASNYQTLNEFKKAIYHYDLALNFVSQGTKKDNDYIYKKGLLIEKELSLLGKLNSEQNIELDLNKYKKVYLELKKINDELKLLDKSTTLYSVLIKYYTQIKDYKNIKINLNNAKELVEKQIKEAKKLSENWRVELFKSDKRILLFDEAYNDLDLENLDGGLKILKELETYEKNDTGISEIRYKVDLKNLYGQIYSRQSKFREAIDSFLLALDILNNSFEKDFELETTVLNNLALAYNDAGEFKLAEKYIAIATNRQENSNRDDFFLITSYNNSAALTFDQEDVLKYSTKAYNLFNKSKTVTKKSDTFVNTINFLGGHFLRKGHLEENPEFKKAHYIKSKEYYDEAIKYVEEKMESNIFPYYQFLYNYSDLVALLNNDYDSCINYQKTTASILENINPKDERLIKNYDLLHACHFQKEEITEGFDFLIKAMGIILYKFDEQNLKLSFDSSYQSISVYKDIVQTFINQVIKHSHNNVEILNNYKDINFLDLIFTLQQVVKSNKLSVKLSESITRQIAKDENVGAELKKYTALIDKRKELLKLDTLDPDQIKKRNLEIKNLNKAIDRSFEIVISKYPDIKKNFSNQVVGGSILYQHIPKDEVLIQYTVGNFKSYASVITSENYNIVAIRANQQKLMKLIKDVRNSLELKNGKPQKFALAKAQDLYDILLSGFEDYIKDKQKIIIIPDGPLYGIPFEILHDKKSNNWLVEKYAISISPSAYSYVSLNYSEDLKFNSGNSFVGFGDPNIKGLKAEKKTNFTDILELEFSKVFTRGGNIDLKYLKMFPELPETATELKKISTKFDDNSKLYLRDEFNENTINSIDFSKYKVVSFASHALVVGEIDGLSEPSIVLSLPKEITKDNDGLLTASEIIELNINSDLVILSACNTASSDGNANSESLSGLANSFFYSGAKSLIVTHWAVISDTSVELMADTFDFLEESKGDITIALMKSKNKMLKNPETSHPIYWAPYTIVGRMKTGI